MTVTGKNSQPFASIRRTLAGNDAQITSCEEAPEEKGMTDEEIKGGKEEKGKLGSLDTMRNKKNHCDYK